MFNRKRKRGGWFDSCETLNDLKARYRALALKYHPDRPNGDLRTMQAINAEHDEAFERLKRDNNAKAAEHVEGVHYTTEKPEEFREILDVLLGLHGLEVELCGSWLWIGGETRENKNALKAAGCRWSRKKGMWYWHHAENGSRFSRGRYSMDQIRDRYGSVHFATEDDEKNALAVA